MKTHRTDSCRSIVRRLVFAVVAMAVVAISSQAQGLSAADMGYDYPRNLSEQVVNPTADATAMLRYQDCPVSYATGTADVSVPLVQLNYGEQSLSLAISYHTGGIKVDDPAGCIGLGWSLQGLGRVSRQICVMPDEKLQFMRAKDLDNPTARDYYNLMFYKKIDNPQSKDANYDRYNYDIPGYSGSFVVDNSSIVDFSQNGVRIVSNFSNNVPQSIMMITPEGLRYTFSSSTYVERCSYKEEVSDGFSKEYNREYENVPVAWMLTDIAHPNMTGGIRIDYATSKAKGKTTNFLTPTVTRKWDSVTPSVASSFKATGIGTSGTTTYTNRAIPSRILCFSDTIYFDIRTVDGSSEDDNRVIRSIRVVNSQGKEVRKITFDNNSLFEDNRPRLDAVTITSDGQLVDKRKFGYNSGFKNSWSDFFGYANGKDKLNSRYTHTYIIDPEKLTLNPDRAFSHQCVSAWALNKITDATGVETTFTYEPNGCKLGNGTESVYNGLRISQIKSYDPLTGRGRSRQFIYEDPQMSIPLRALSLRNFISLSGIMSYNGIRDIAHETYSLSATFTTSSNNAGVAAEKMRIYYGKVTETVSGSDMSPVKTDYIFDNSHCISTLVSDLPIYDPKKVRALSSDLYFLGDPDRIKLGYNLQAAVHEYYPTNDFYNVFGLRTETTNFDEIANPQPLLVKKVSYEFVNGSYRPVETTEKFYSSHDGFKFPVGIFVQSNVFRTYYLNEFYHNIYDGDCPADPLTSTLHERSWVYSERIRLDSTAVTRHYPDGNRRTVWQRHHYNNLISKIEKALYENPDSILPAPADTLTFAAKSLLPVSTVTGSGDDYIIHNTIRACNIVRKPQDKRPNYLTERSLGNTPVTERWIVRSGNKTDSLLLRRDFGVFCYNACIKPSYVTLGREPSALIAWQKFNSYNFRGNVTSMTGSDGLLKKYTWDDTGFLLTSKNIGGLTSEYTWQPLVGCTSIINPSGRTHSYSYSGGRLSEERNTAGKTVATYSYSLYADSGQNMTEASVCNDQGAATTRVWYDGFGLPVQSVAVGAGADASQDVCSFTEYDGLDRSVRQWQPLPVSGTDCIYSESDLRSFASEVYGADMRPFTETAYLASEGEKTAAVYMPGDALADYPARTEYLCNNPAIPELKVNRISLNSSQTYISIPGTYPAGQLDAVKTVDPDGHTVITFTDWRGFKILERRVVAENDYLDTYYVNDCWGNPLVVIQPELSARYKDRTLISLKLSSPNAAKYIFQYRYDRCGRLVSKKIPGCEPVTYRYDPYGRLAFMQDGNMRDSGRAMFTVYDEASRVAVTGMCDDHAMADDVSVPAMTAVFDGSLTSGGLCDTGYAFEGSGLLSDASLLTATYYDSYGFLSLPLFSGLPTSSTSDANSRGLKTGSLTAVLDSSDSSSAPIAVAIFYDDEERPIKTVSTTHLADTYEFTKTQYTIDSQPKTVTHNIVKNKKNTYLDTYHYVYDETGRQKTIFLTVTNSYPKPLIVSNEYNSIGQLKRTVTDGVSTSYTYNVRGAVKTISNDQLLFNQVLYYEDGDNPLYSGKISAVRDNMGKRIFRYDGVGRLLSSVNTVTNFISFPYDNEIFTAEYTYDLNSNITSIDRRGYINDRRQYKADYVDNLILSYDGNQLRQVTDNAPEILDSYSYDFQDGADMPSEYEYDSNGNLVADQNRGVSEVKYNEIGLPRRISFNNNRHIENRYSADGVKLSSDLILVGRELDDDIIIKSLIPGETEETSAAGNDAVVIPGKERIRLKVVIDSKTYLGDYEFSGDSLIRFNTPYGYFLGGNFYANVYDYQGNLAVSGGEYFCGVAQENSYYPYGLPVRGGGTTKFTSYLYGGKEFENRQGLNIYDFKARTYVPDECRFWQPDPMADDYHWLSPYAYCLGDPINFIDPNGEKVYYVDMTGHLITSEEVLNNISDRNTYETEFKGYDCILIIDNDGKVFSKSSLFKEGTIILHDNSKSELKGLDVTLWEITGDEASKSIFEFFSKHITRSNGIEYGHIMRGSGKGDNKNAVFTGHQARRLSNFNEILNYQRKAKGIFREIIHSHQRYADPSSSDIISRDQVIEIFKSKKRKNPTFKIYVSDIPMYVNYTKY